MASRLQTFLQHLRGNYEKQWDDARRRAALREIEEQFQVRLTEEEVFRAATLFLALLSEYSFIHKDAVVHEVHRHLRLLEEEEQESTL
jgi:hypothetical protein